MLLLKINLTQIFLWRTIITPATQQSLKIVDNLLANQEGDGDMGSGYLETVIVLVRVNIFANQFTQINRCKLILSLDFNIQRGTFSYHQEN